jgi:hypothetical protein
MDLILSCYDSRANAGGLVVKQASRPAENWEFGVRVLASPRWRQIAFDRKIAESIINHKFSAGQSEARKV